MQQIIFAPISDFRQNLADYSNLVAYQNNLVKVTRNGKVIFEVQKSKTPAQQFKSEKNTQNSSPAKSAFGMWADYWPPNKQNKSIALELRDKAWQGEYAG